MSDKRLQHSSVLPRQSIGFGRKSLHGAKAVGSFLPSLTAKAFQRYGFSAASLIMDWPSIVGREISQYATPERLNWPRAVERAEDDDAAAAVNRAGAVLVLRVDGARALDVQYRARQIMERINGYYGYAAVAQLRVIQAPMRPPPARRAPRAKAAPLVREVAGIADPRLRDALARLGAEIRTSR